MPLKPNASLCVYIALGGLLVLPHGSVTAAQTETNQGRIVLESIEGTVEVARDGLGHRVIVTNGTGWSSLVSFQTKALSRATFRMGEFTTVRAGANTEVEVALLPDGRTLARLKQGRLFFLHRDHRGRFTVETPAASATVLGTEFGIMVAANATTTVDLFDGEVELANAANTLKLAGRSAARVEVGQPPEKTAVIQMTRAVQWNLYYPAIINPRELALDDATTAAMATSLAAYQAGDLLGAVAGYPKERQPASRAEALYRAGLLLVMGEADEALRLVGLPRASTSSAPSEPLDSVERGLRRLIAVVLEQPAMDNSTPKSAAEWLARSYEHQSRGQLAEALADAQEAVSLDNHFSFALAREAELEFSFGRTAAAKRAIDAALALSPRNAQALTLQGFLAAGQGRFAEARQHFEEVTRADPALANGWLGRGLCRLHARDWQGGLSDLQIAATVEPTRAILRSYLAKAYAENWDPDRANQEFALAKTYDPQDPTAWLYSALFLRQQYRFNEAITNLERSIELNDHRAVYRSRLRLDEDRAVRGVNLASLYQNVGLADVSVTEASRAVTADYANYSAHLFLANSYNQQRDPNLVNLRYETATFSEYLLANLLSPVGGSALSPYVSQQEYSRLFDYDRLGFSSETTYLSPGDWQQQASQYGWFDNTSYAFDVFYRSEDGKEPNTDLQQQSYSIQLKQQLTPQDSIYAQAIFNDYDSGDVRQLYDPGAASPSLRVTESRTPNLFAGYHHEWSPGVHTLLLAGRLEDRFSLSDQNVRIRGMVRDATGAVVDTVEEISRRFGVDPPEAGETFDVLTLRSEFEAYSLELQQIAEVSQHTLTFGVRYQDGQTETTSEQARAAGRFPPYDTGFNDFVASQENTTDLTRLNCYAYDQWHVLEPLWLVAGLSYDQLHFPWNIDLSPVSAEERDTSQLSPKAGFIWTPRRATTFRGAFTRSLGGLFYDSSVRLEPVQIAGFNQAYRSLISESVEGAIPGAQFQTFDLGFEQRFKSGTYLFGQVELLQSEASRDEGVFDFDPNGIQNAAPSQIRQELDYEEQSLVLGLNQLLGNEWSLGARYKLSQADLKSHYPDVSTALIPDVHNRAVLQNLNLFAIYNHPGGFFAEAQALWYEQSNHHYDPELPGDNFWQFNLFTGYRFPRQRAELTVGLLNLTDEDYRLNPLNPHPELPRERTLLVSLKLNF